MGAVVVKPVQKTHNSAKACESAILPHTVTIDMNCPHDNPKKERKRSVATERRVLSDSKEKTDRNVSVDSVPPINKPAVRSSLPEGIGGEGNGMVTSYTQLIPALPTFVNASQFNTPVPCRGNVQEPHGLVTSARVSSEAMVGSEQRTEGESNFFDEAKATSSSRSITSYERNGRVHSLTAREGSQRRQPLLMQMNSKSFRTFHDLSARRTLKTDISDGRSVIDSAANFSQVSNGPSTHTSRATPENVKTLLNAKAVLRKHVHKSFLSPQANTSTTSFYSLARTTTTDDETSTQKYGNPLAPHSICALNSPIARSEEENGGGGTEFGVGGYEEGRNGVSNRNGRSNKTVLPTISPLLSFPSPRLNYCSSTKRHDMYSAEKLQHCGVMDSPTVSGAAGDLTDQSLNRSNQPPPPCPAPLFDPHHLKEKISPVLAPPHATLQPAPHKIAPLDNAESRTRRTLPGSIGRENTPTIPAGMRSPILATASVGLSTPLCGHTPSHASEGGKSWVAIGAEGGVETADWYARLRDRGHLEESGGIDETVLNNNNNAVEDCKKLTPVVCEKA